MAETQVQRRLAAVLAADIAGYARLMGADEGGTVTALRTVWAERFHPAVAVHRGRLVKLMGDGALIEFSSAIDAVECAVAIQRAMADHNAGRRADPIEFRIGVNLGDIVIEGDDILGEGVNLAARLQAAAPASGILISDAVHAQIRGKASVAFEDAGELQLKNIAAPVRAWRWTGSRTGEMIAPKLASAGARLPSIAVLPFGNLSGDPDQSVFADGLVEDIITALAKLSGLVVIARNSSAAYRGADVRRVGTELGVRYVLDGSVRKTGDRIRIAAQLIDAKSAAHVWAQRYDRTVEDIFTIQDEITLNLATEMQVTLTEGEQARLRHSTTRNVEAWNQWVQGLALFRQAVTREKLGAARPFWERALALDPSSATFNAMLGFVHYCDARFGWWEDPAAALSKAAAYADRALALDPANADAHITASVVQLMGGRFEAAARHARQAVRLAPAAADAATFACFVLASCGFAEEAVGEGERAMTLSPNCPGYYLGHLGNAYRLAGRTQEAIAAFKAYEARAPGFGVVDLAIVYQQSGEGEQARQAAARLIAARRDFTIAGWAKTQFRADSARLARDIEALRAAGLPADGGLRRARTACRLRSRHRRGRRRNP